jgi:transcriptional regulator with XRE-family HTH domain
MEEIEEIYAQVGRVIRKYRKKANLTQAELGSRAGLSRTSVTHMESGEQRIQLHILYAIADALKVNPQTLLPSVDQVEKIICKICEFNFIEVYGDLEALKALNSKPYKLMPGEGKGGKNKVEILCLNCCQVLRSNPNLTPESFYKRVKKNKLNKT